MRLLRRRQPQGQRAGGGPGEYARRVIKQLKKQDASPSHQQRTLATLYWWSTGRASLPGPRPVPSQYSIHDHLDRTLAALDALPRNSGERAYFWVAANAPDVRRVGDGERRVLRQWADTTRPNLSRLSFAEARVLAGEWETKQKVKVNARKLRQALEGPFALVTFRTHGGEWRRFSGREEDLWALRAVGSALGHCYKGDGYDREYGLDPNAEVHTFFVRGKPKATLFMVEGSVSELKKSQNAPVLPSDTQLAAAADALLRGQWKLDLMELGEASSLLKHLPLRLLLEDERSADMDTGSYWDGQAWRAGPHEEVIEFFQAMHRMPVDQFPFGVSSAYVSNDSSAGAHANQWPADKYKSLGWPELNWAHEGEPSVFYVDVEAPWDQFELLSNIVESLAQSSEAAALEAATGLDFWELRDELMDEQCRAVRPESFPAPWWNDSKSIQVVVAPHEDDIWAFLLIDVNRLVKVTKDNADKGMQLIQDAMYEVVDGLNFYLNPSEPYGYVEVEAAAWRTVLEEALERVQAGGPLLPPPDAAGRRNKHSSRGKWATERRKRAWKPRHPRGRRKMITRGPTRGATTGHVHEGKRAPKPKWTHAFVRAKRKELALIKAADRRSGRAARVPMPHVDRGGPATPQWWEPTVKLTVEVWRFRRDAPNQPQPQEVAVLEYYADPRRAYEAAQVAAQFVPNGMQIRWPGFGPRGERYEVRLVGRRVSDNSLVGNPVVLTSAPGVFPDMPGAPGQVEDAPPRGKVGALLTAKAVAAGFGEAG